MGLGSGRNEVLPCSQVVHPQPGIPTVELESTRAVVAAGRAAASVGHRVPKLLPGLTLAPAALGSLWQLQHPHLPVTDLCPKSLPPSRAIWIFQTFKVAGVANVRLSWCLST